jgi:hypothetical protein
MGPGPQSDESGTRMTWHINPKAHGAMIFILALKLLRILSSG